MTTQTESPTSLVTNARPWWLTLIGGIAAFVVGAMLLWGTRTTQVETWLVLVQLLGVYWLVVGMLDIVHMFLDHSAWAWKLFVGIISIVAGSYILMYPVASAVALPRVFVLVLGIWALMQGVVMLVMAFKGAGWGAGILGVLAVIFGVVLMVNYNSPGSGLSMIWAAAVTGLVGGVVLVWRAFAQRSESAA